MPALPDVPAVIRMDHHFTIGEDLAAKCRLFFQYSGTAPDATQLSSVAGAAGSSFVTHLKPQMRDDRILTSIICTDLTSPTSALGVEATPVTGTNGGAELPADVCLLQSLAVSRRYRGGHPRVYWPFGSAAELLNAQQWVTSFVATMTTELGDYVGDIVAAVWTGGGTLTPVNVSYYSGFTVHTGVTGRARNVSTVRLVPVVDPIINHTVRQGVGSQRKRLLRLA